MVERAAFIWLLLSIASLVNSSPLRQTDGHGNSRYEYDVKHPSGISRVLVRTGGNNGGSYPLSGHNSHKPFSNSRAVHSQYHKPLSSESYRTKPYNGASSAKPPAYVEHAQASHLYPRYDVYSKHPADHYPMGGIGLTPLNSGFSYPHTQQHLEDLNFHQQPNYYVDNTDESPYGSVSFDNPVQTLHEAPVIQQTSEDVSPNFEPSGYEPSEISQIPVGILSVSSENIKPQIDEQIHIEVSPPNPSLTDADVGKIEQAPVVQIIDNQQLIQDVYEPSFAHIGNPSTKNSFANQPQYHFIPVGEPYEKISHSTEIKHPTLPLKSFAEVTQPQILVDSPHYASQLVEDPLVSQKHIDVGPTLTNIPSSHSVKLPPQEFKFDHQLPPAHFSIKSAVPPSIGLPPPSQELLHDIAPPASTHSIKLPPVSHSVKLPPPSQELVHDIVVPPTHSIKSAPVVQTVKLPPPSQELLHDIPPPASTHSIKLPPQGVKLPPPSLELVHDIVVPPPTHSIKLPPVSQSVKLPPPSLELVHDIVVPPPTHSINSPPVLQTVKLPPASTHSIKLPPVSQSVKLPPPAQELVHDIVVPPPTHSIKLPPVSHTVKLPPPSQEQVLVDAPPLSSHSVKTSLPSTKIDPLSVKVLTSNSGTYLENAEIDETLAEKSPSTLTDPSFDPSVPNLFAKVPAPSDEDFGLKQNENAASLGQSSALSSLPVPQAQVSGPINPSNFHNYEEDGQRQRFPAFPVESALKQQDPVADKVSDLSQGYRNSAGYDNPNHGPVEYDDEEDSKSPDVIEARLEVDRISKEIGSSFGRRLPGF